MYSFDLRTCCIAFYDKKISRMRHYHIRGFFCRSRWHTDLFYCVHPSCSAYADRARQSVLWQTRRPMAGELPDSQKQRFVIPLSTFVKATKNGRHFCRPYCLCWLADFTGTCAGRRKILLDQEQVVNSMLDIQIWYNEATIIRFGRNSLLVRAFATKFVLKR